MDIAILKDDTMHEVKLFYSSKEQCLYVQLPNGKVAKLDASPPQEAKDE